MNRRTYAPNRLRELRKAAGLTLDEVGARMKSDMAGSTVAKLERGKQALSVDYLLELAEILNVSPAEIIHKEAREVRWLPAIGFVEASQWGEAVRNSDEFVPVPAHLKGRNLFVLYPYGDSMNKVVPEGGYVVVDPDDRELRHGKYYVLMNDGQETTFKKFSSDPLQLLPCSNNPAHEPIPLGSEPFTVVGRVVFIGSEV